MREYLRRERQLRRKAVRQGYVLHKVRGTDRYYIVDPMRNVIETGDPRIASLSLDEVESWLEQGDGEG